MATRQVHLKHTAGNPASLAEKTIAERCRSSLLQSNSNFVLHRNDCLQLNVGANWCGTVAKVCSPALSSGTDWTSARVEAVVFAPF